jgi:4-amino-4-deoxy-L-arabinose transferase-like glycosyltransferase
MAWILVVVGILHAVGIGWGLPASDGWDNDGVAPRDFLPGLAATFTPGRFYTYPPVHLAVLAILTLPIVLVGAARAPSLALHDLVGETLKVPYMTLIAYVARSVSLLMSLGIVLFLARIAEELRAHELGLMPPSDASGGRWTDERVRRAGWCTAAFAGTNASLTYYAHTTNLDVPYLFWGTWSLLLFTRAITRRQPRLLRRALAFAVLAVGTKDQAYGLFLLSLPPVFAIWMLRDGWAREHRGRVLKEAVLAVAGALALFAVVDAVLVNPTGFMARVRFLTGSASRDFVEYTRDWVGRFGILTDAVRLFHLQYPNVLGPVIVLGLVHAIVLARRTPGERRATQLALTLLPLLVAISFTITFNWSSLRTDARFLLPQALVLAVYGGRAIDAFVFAEHRGVRIAGRAVAGFDLAFALFACISVDVNLLFDPRYDAEAWLRSHVRPGETIETYGLNVYMPRMPAQARVLRVGPEPVAKRNPMPGIEEVQAPFGEAGARGTRWIVVNTGWVWRYIDRWPDLGPGRRRPPTVSRTVVDKGATDFFDSLVAGDRGFKIAHESRYDDHIFPLVDIHGASGRSVWIYERTPD